MATTTTTFSVLSLGDAALEKLDPEAEADPDGGRRARVRVRTELGIGSFGINAVYQAASGARVIGEHDELGPGASHDEELYVVVSGGAAFTVDGEEVAAPQGTAVFVRDPAAKRSATATEDGTIVLAIGGRPGRGLAAGTGGVDRRVLPAPRDQGLRGRPLGLPRGARGLSGQRDDPLQRRVLPKPARQRRRGARAARGGARRLARLQRARSGGRGLRVAAGRRPLPGSRRLTQ